MQRTKISSLIWVGLIAAPIGWTISRLVDAASYALPPVPVVVPLLLLFLAVVLEFAGRTVRSWVVDRRFDEQVDALRVARVLVLAKAAAVFGAAVAGGYIGLAFLAVDALDVPMGRNRLLMSVIVVVVAIALAIAAVRCERACVAPPSDDSDN